MLRKPWPCADKPMSFESLRSMFDASRYRVAEYCYPPGASFSGRTQAVAWFVLSGSCRLSVDEEILLQEGDVAEIGPANFSLVVGGSELRLVQVWDLGPHMD